MPNKPSKVNPETKFPTKTVNRFKMEALTEMKLQLLALFFICSLFAIVHYLPITLVSTLDASKAYVLIGLIGFLVLYSVRERFGLSLLDGLYYNVFGIAPITLALLFIVNGSCSEYYTESYHITRFERDGNNLIIELKDGVYDEFWSIRKIELERKRIQVKNVHFTFCNGHLGYKVLQGKRID